MMGVVVYFLFLTFRFLILLFPFHFLCLFLQISLTAFENSEEQDNHLTAKVNICGQSTTEPLNKKVLITNAFEKLLPSSYRIVQETSLMYQNSAKVQSADKCNVSKNRLLHENFLRIYENFKFNLPDKVFMRLLLFP